MNWAASLEALVYIMLIAAATFTIGRKLIGPVWRFEHAAIQASAETATGLILLSFLIFALSVFHSLSRQVLFCLFSMAAIWALIALPRVNFVYKKPLLRAALFFCLLYLGWMLACAALPPADRDELIYHLEIPKQFLAHGGLTPFADNIYGYFPQFGEMLFLFGLGVCGESAAKLWHVFYGFLLAATLYGYSRSSLNRQNAFLAAAVFMSVPLVFVSMPLAYVDLIFSLYAFLALLCLLRYFKTKLLRWLALCGIFIGTCLSVKYTGLQILILFLCLFALHAVQEHRPGLLRSAPFLILPALAVAFPYLFRNWYFTGWPLFPFNSGNPVLHAGINWDPIRAHLYLEFLHSYGTSKGGSVLWHGITAPVLVFLKARFNDPDLYEGVIGPVFLLIPFLFAFKRNKNQEARWLAFYTVLFLYYWSFTTKQSRFLIPILPVLCFLLVTGLANAGKKIFYAPLGLCLLFNSFVGIKEITKKEPWRFWLFGESRQDYLRRQWSGYAISQETNKKLGPTDRLYLLGMKNYLYYFDCPLRTDLVFDRYSVDRALDADASVKALLHFFEARNITHLLIDEAFLKKDMEPRKWGLFKSFLAQRTDIAARDGKYALYRLKP